MNKISRLPSSKWHIGNYPCCQTLLNRRENRVVMCCSSRHFLWSTRYPIMKYLFGRIIIFLYFYRMKQQFDTTSPLLFNLFSAKASIRHINYTSHLKQFVCRTSGAKPTRPRFTTFPPPAHMRAQAHVCTSAKACTHKRMQAHVHTRVCMHIVHCTNARTHACVQLSI